MYQVLHLAQDHEAWLRRMIFCPPPTQVTERLVSVTKNIHFTFVNVFIMLTMSKAQTALASALLEGNCNTQPALCTLQSLGIRLFGSLATSGKFILRATSAHATSSPTAAWQGARET